MLESLKVGGLHLSTLLKKRLQYRSLPLHLFYRTPSDNYMFLHDNFKYLINTSRNYRVVKTFFILKKIGKYYLESISKLNKSGSTGILMVKTIFMRACKKILME